jgi:hypothetical protein
MSFSGTSMVAVGANIPFAAVVYSPAGTHISIQTTGVITINATGFYQITWGYSQMLMQNGIMQLNGTNFTTGIWFVLQAASPSPPVPKMITISNIIHITTAPATVFIENTGSSTVTVAPVGAAMGGGTCPAAFMSIVKLQ